MCCRSVSGSFLSQLLNARAQLRPLESMPKKPIFRNRSGVLRTVQTTIFISLSEERRYPTHREVGVFVHKTIQVIAITLNELAKLLLVEQSRDRLLLLIRSANSL